LTRIASPTGIEDKPRRILEMRAAFTASTTTARSAMIGLVKRSIHETSVSAIRATSSGLFPSRSNAWISFGEILLGGTAGFSGRTGRRCPGPGLDSSAAASSISAWRLAISSSVRLSRGFTSTVYVPLFAPRRVENTRLLRSDENPTRCSFTMRVPDDPP
jgi:hypothetical protein